MKAEYIDHMGDDLRVANSARVSFDKESDYSLIYENFVNERDEKLIQHLARHGHWAPFSHPVITMRETVPIYVARQRFRHVVGFTYNEINQQDINDTPSFYTPMEWRSRPEGSIKQGSGERLDDTKSIDQEYAAFLDAAAVLYKKMLLDGVAPEQARMVFPQSMFTSYVVTGSLAAWARAYNLRSDSHSQIEIRKLAKQWGDIIRPLFPVSWEAITDKVP